jgi:flagellar motor switch protein FliN/FliY
MAYAAGDLIMSEIPEAHTGGPWLMEQWTAAVAAVLESMTDERPEMAFAPLPASESWPAAETLCWEQGFKGIPQPGLWVAVLESSWLELGGRTLRAAGIEAAEPADARNTYLEILSQSLASLAQSLTARLGKEVLCERGSERKPADSPAIRFSVTLKFADAELALEAALGSELVDWIEPAQDGASSQAAPVKAAAEAAKPSGPAPSKNLDLLLDVDLPVSVSFGRTRILVKDILKLTTGSIVELNRSVSEPVEVIVNNCTVARGEVVVIEGNYGVRIHQIISRQDRLRNLR